MTKEKSKEVSTTSKQELMTEQDQAVIEQLRANSGEGQARPFIAIYQVDNTKVKEKMSDGREVDALCAPRWKRTDKDGVEYVTTNVPTFKGVILKTMWQVENKGKWDDKVGAMVANDAPMFSSPLFSPSVLFGHSLLDIKLTDTGEILSMTYPELKAKFEKSFNLIGWVFVLTNSGELVRVKAAGASRSPLFDYPKTFRANDSISAHVTLFSATYEEKPQPHNIAKFELSDEPVDINAVLTAQSELNMLFDFDNAATRDAEALGGEVLPAEPITEPIVINGPAFD